MRKIKIYFTLAIAVMLFATTSCIDNTESESVSALRNAKASELLANADYLKAQAQYLKDKAAIEKIIAEAEATLTEAKAATEAAQADYLRALGAQAKLQGKADSLRAAAEIIRAEAEQTLANAEQTYAEAAKLEAEARAKYLEAQALQIELRAKADSARSNESLRLLQAQNDLKIKQLEYSLAQAEKQAEISMVRLQLQYLLAIGNLELHVAQKYSELVGYLYEQLNIIATANTTIAENTLAIANYESNLAWAKIDSVRAVKQQTAYLTQLKVRDSLRVVNYKYQLSVLEAEDGGVTKAAEAKQVLVDDTTNALIALNEAIIEAAAKKAALEAVTPAYETALANYTTASDNLLNYYSVTAGGYTLSYGPYNYFYNASSVTFNGATYSLGDLISDNNWTTVRPGNYGYRYQNVSFQDMTNLVYVQLYIEEDFEIIDGVDQPPYSQYIQWVVREITKHYYSFDTKYVSVEQLVHDIEAKKVEVEEKAAILANAALDLDNAIASLAEYSALELTTNAALKVAAKAKTDAQTALTEARTAFYAARDKGQLNTATEQDTLDWVNAAKNYNWTDIYGVDLADKNTVLDVSKQKLYNDANTAHTDAGIAHSNALTQYNAYIGTVRSRIDGHITAKGNYEIAVTDLARLESYKPILELGTRDKLEFALQEAEKALEAPKKAYINAEYESVDADIKLANAQSIYDATKTSLAKFEDWYSKWIVGEITTAEGVNINIGNYLNNLANRANNIAHTQDIIANYEYSIAQYEKQLANIGDAGAYFTGSIYEAIATARAAIERAEAEKAEATQKAEGYQAAIDAFLAEYGE
jgi:hypothetical protein